jgi:hypothetical protein
MNLCKLKRSKIGNCSIFRKTFFLYKQIIDFHAIHRNYEILSKSLVPTVYSSHDTDFKTHASALFEANVADLELLINSMAFQHSGSEHEQKAIIT